MGVKKFLSVAGVIRGEVREGEAPRQFVLDAMGSVVEVYQAGSLKADASYTADGDMLSASWNMSSYSFRWLGGWGYRYTGKDWMNTYVRARHYSTSDGAWGSVDPLWPDEAAYRYVEGRVMGAVDPSGMRLTFKGCDSAQINIVTNVFEFIDKSLRSNRSREHWPQFTECLADCAQGSTFGGGKGGVENCMEDLISGKMSLRVHCKSGGGGALGQLDVLGTKRGIVLFPPFFGKQRKQGGYLSLGLKNQMCVVLHELLHVCGLIHPKNDDYFDCLDNKLGDYCNGRTKGHYFVGQYGDRKGKPGAVGVPIINDRRE